MKKLLYITVNSKPEEQSVSRTVGREFVKKFLKENPGYMVEELDLYNASIPELNHKIYQGRAQLTSGAEYEGLSAQNKKAVDDINKLCDQFLSADTYVIAAPMWSISFPSRLKRYIDCIVINDKVIKVSQEEVKGLLDDKERNMVYIQSSGGVYPKILSSQFNHGINYCKDIFKFLGIQKFEKILVEGVDMQDVGREEAIKNSYKDIDKVINKLSNKAFSGLRG